jgi:hypothetical protein
MDIVIYLLIPTIYQCAGIKLLAYNDETGRAVPNLEETSSMA